MIFDKTYGVLLGVPLQKDIGVLEFVVEAISKRRNYYQEVTIKIVNKDINHSECLDSNNTILSLAFDKNVNSIKSIRRVLLIKKIAELFSVPDVSYCL